MKIRIGKELRISWSILTQGENKPLEGRNLRLYLQEPNRQRRTLDFTTDANTLLTILPANTLTRLGKYALILTENEGQDAQTAVDASPAFTLVETTEEEDPPTTEDPNLEIAYINLATGNLTLRMVIQELFSGKEGGDLKTGDILPVLRNGELTRVTKKKIYKGIFHKAVPAYPKDGYAYIYRGLPTFNPAFKMESPSQIMQFVEFFKAHEEMADGFINVFTDNTRNECIAIADLYGGEGIDDLERKLLEYVPENEFNSYLILLTGSFHAIGNVAIYIDNPGDKKVPIYECNVRIVPSYGPLFKNNIEMQSPRFTIQGGRVFCTEIPAIDSNDVDDEKIISSGRTNIYLRKNRKHGRRLINHFDNFGKYIMDKKSNRRTPVRLNCGETSSFQRIRYMRNIARHIYRGRSIYTIETTLRQLFNSLGVGNIYV